MKLISSILSGFLSSPLVIGWFALMAIVVNAIYDKVLAPIALLYGHEWPDVPFWQWIVFCLLVSFIQFTFWPTRKNDLTREETGQLMGKRIGLATCFLAMSYLINWIWL